MGGFFDNCCKNICYDENNTRIYDSNKSNQKDLRSSQLEGMKKNANNNINVNHKVVNRDNNISKETNENNIEKENVKLAGINIDIKDNDNNNQAPIINNDNNIADNKNINGNNNNQENNTNEINKESDNKGNNNMGIEESQKEEEKNDIAYEYIDENENGNENGNENNNN